MKTKAIYEEGILKPIEVFYILPISELEVEECYKAIKDYALLTNDAFERVEWRKVWKS